MRIACAATDGKPVGDFDNAHFFLAGGCGASQGRDGIGRNCFTSNAQNVPVEVVELRAPVLVRNRSLRPDSAGRGQWRGAFGHQFEVGRLPGFEESVSFFFDPDRLRFPPRGLVGGEDGPVSALYRNGEHLTPDEIAAGQVMLEHKSDRFEWRVPGGAGYRNPANREMEAATGEVRAGLCASD